MVSAFASRSKKRRVIARVAMMSGALLVLGGAIAYNKLFSRPGEGALRFVPADALMVGSADLTPAPNQTLVFKKIDDALTKAGLDKHIDGALTDLVAQGPAADKLRPYAKRGAAFAMLPMEKGDKEFDPGDSMVAFFAISDGPEVAKILKQHGKPAFWRGTRFQKLQAEGPGLMVVEDVLVVGMGKALHQVELVAENQKDSIEENPEFVAERSKIDPDANLKFFMAPSAMETFTQDAPEEARNMMAANKWIAVGVTIRDGGLALSFNGSYDQDKASWLKPFANIAPLRSDLMSVLPKGAYGFSALAQPSKYFESFEAAMSQDKDGRKEMAEFEREASKELGMSLRQDILPAFQGNAIVGYYPSPDAATPAGADILLVVDDQNGAKAAALAERIRERVEQEIMSEGGDIPFLVKTEGDVKRFSLADEVNAELQDGLNEGIQDSPIKGDVLTKNKTITWALVGQTVVASTSAKLLDQAIDGLKSRENGLESDPRWTGRSKSLVEGQQILSTFNVARIVEGFVNTIDMKKMGDDEKTIQEVVKALSGLNEPFVIQSSTAGSTMSVGMFIPMEWESLIDLIGRNIEQ